MNNNDNNHKQLVIIEEPENNKNIDKFLSSFIKQNNSTGKLHSYLFVMIGLIILLLIWSMFSNMAQTIQIKGQVTPLDAIAKIRHELGGEIVKINVKNYDKVAKGEILVVLDDKKILTSLRQYKSKLKVTDSEIAHAVSYLKDNLKLLKGNEEFEQVETYVNNISETISQSAQLTEASKLISDNQDIEIKSQIEQNTIELNSLKQEIAVLQEQLKYLDDQRQIFNTLLESKNISKIRALDYEIKYRDVLIALKKAKADYESKSKATNELNSKRIVQQQDTIKQKYKDLIDLNKDKIDLISNIDQLENNLKNIVIRSPIAGIVQGVEVASGTTIEPGKEILSIVPSDSVLVFEAKAALQQKGKIELNNKAEVQFDGFNILRYSRIPAKIINISPYTFNGTLGQEDYIKVVAELESKEITAGSSNYEIKPGMSGVLYVTTDEQSLFTYIFGPIYDAFSQLSDQKQS